MLEWIRARLIEPELRNVDVDSTEFTLRNLKVLKRKKILRELFESFYQELDFIDKAYFSQASGRCLEIGSGSSLIKETYPDVITSDIKNLPHVDKVFSALKMPFSDNYLRSIYGINVFHHLRDPSGFFNEASRVLRPGGGMILIEPYYGPFATVLLKHLHSSEGFDPYYPTWETHEPTGPLSNANQALSYIVFKREVQRFNDEFPEFEILLDKPHTHIWYLLSGGVNFRQLAPDYMTRFIRNIEKVLAPLNPWLAILHTIVIRKRKLN